jgi:hypothetical protein
VPALPEKSALNKSQLLASGKADEEFQEVLCARCSAGWSAWPCTRN